MLIPNNPSQHLHRPGRGDPADVYVVEVPFVADEAEVPPKALVNGRTRILNASVPMDPSV
jgi:hypothetical protein